MRLRDAVLNRLQEADGQYISGAALAKQLGVSRNAIWKTVQLLQDKGFPIISKKRLGYRMPQRADVLTAEQLEIYLQDRTLGKPMYVLPEVDSTNNYCRRLIREGAGHGTLVAANCQTAGKGRQGRSFCSPAGSGLYFSVLISPDLPLQDAPLITGCAAVAVARAIDALYGTHIQIKWVNDLYLNRKKCCGILTEGEVSLESDRLEYAVIGIGINIRNTAKALPEELQNKVTSLEEAVPDCHVRRAELLAAILYELEQGLQELPRKRFLNEYRSRSYLTGKTAEIVMGNGTRRKIAVLEIANDCGLVIRDSAGNIETLHSGEVHVTNIE